MMGWEKEMADETARKDLNQENIGKKLLLSAYLTHPTPSLKIFDILQAPTRPHPTLLSLAHTTPHEVQVMPSGHKMDENYFLILSELRKGITW